MLPYILSILKNSGRSETIASVCEKSLCYDSCPNPGDDIIEDVVERSLNQAIEMGLVKKDKERPLYRITVDRWFMPESQAFQSRMHEVVQKMPQALSRSVATGQKFAQLAAEPNQLDCGPRSPAQARAIAIYRRMRAEREQAETAARARKRHASSGNRSRNRSRSRNRQQSRSRQRSRSHPRSQTQRSTFRSRTTSPRTRNRSKSKSRTRQ
ncbi:splicing regulatory glutamine/lysine-rich protein 1-like [Anopheles albimanus]|uniref:splicing regulatory glutamine/lysine-rich protein 1-like n=1 Tax=Anopheles albimanus TaxID=7167 RepID=UPI00163F7286|nr:splicing regulatory glutamine/lysine-rich protein 1-like [Anopheles albimanus]